MKVAILYVCTGGYIKFWDEFYQSAERHFMPGAEQRQYFVFTDQKFDEQHLPHVTRVEQPNLGWPDNTLKRYHMFLRIESQLAEFDYMYFFNANCIFRQDVGNEFLPDRQDQLVVVRHPGQVQRSINDVPYERNPRSLAHIPREQGSYYVYGGVNGGSAKAFLALSHAVQKAVDRDLREGIVAQWHDESHLNRYILDHPHCVRHAGYCYPQNWTLSEPKMIEVRDKNILEGTEKLRALGTKNQPENMVTVAIFGGLGNQMFQYCVGRTLANRLNCRLQLDLRHYDHHRAFRYGLGEFHIDAVIGTEKTLPPQRADRFSYLCWRYFSNRHRMVREKALGFDPNILGLHGSLYLKGYWQSEKYFIEIAELIRSQFQLNRPATGQNLQTLEQIRSGPSIAIHVRRGDYVTNPNANKFHGTCPPEYYTRAVDRILETVSATNTEQLNPGGISYSAGNRILETASATPTVYVFSDDCQWAQQNIHLDCEMVFVNHNDNLAAHEDLRLMAACEHQVISNSTFSWWAAWLNSNPNKQIIAPEKWFADAKAQNSDLVPDSWQRVSNTPSTKQLTKAA